MLYVVCNECTCLPNIWFKCFLKRNYLKLLTLQGFPGYVLNDYIKIK